MAASDSSRNNLRLIAVGAVILLVGVILVLLILRGSIGDEGRDAGQASSAAEQTAQADGSDTTGDEGAASDDRAEVISADEQRTARVPMPLQPDEGAEAVTVRTGFDRGAAALPRAGDQVAVYALPAAEEDAETDDTDEEPEAAERVLDEVEVLGVIGPRPAANEGTLTVVLEVDADEVDALLPLARDGAVWLTLLPGDEAEADGDTGASADGDAPDDGSEQ